MPHKDAEERRAYAAAWHAAHRQEGRARTAARRVAHPEECRAYKAAYYAAHREELRVTAADYQEAHPEVYREANRKRYALKRQVRKVAPERVLTRAQWNKVLRLAKGRCYYCKRKRKLTQDHVIPLSKGGLHVAENVVAACMRCNCRKQAKVITLF